MEQPTLNKADLVLIGDLINQNVNPKFEALTELMIKGFERVDERFEGVYSRLDGLERRIDDLSMTALNTQTTTSLLSVLR